ncbi:winged helix-turn-helix domain-containing protein [Bradyrhizobium sp.]|uniref:winged helix-turn-helix domain-containing protein n=1 Tax=Bradyrhizobium sp. TaxID=376 RepID=UPI001ED398F8|nr:winged helix-turn-helix domain-containing protein [Bradyrhizobium sp.]MBV8919847.1 winged helix-turn-helix domain-containing protein [Bradyrhizobium sp.]MBV9980893.1 winged helix-turn-helix domain-containing protein [Bradyrhizobium sp.]
MGQQEARAKGARAVRCGIYEVDFAAGELRRNGFKVPLQEQPFRILARLLANPGSLVTREELQEQLWGEHSLVDADLGLNTAIKKLRAAFGDSADNPRFIETLPRRGYRFIAPVQPIVADTSVDPMLVATPQSDIVEKTAERTSAKNGSEVDSQAATNGPLAPTEEPIADGGASDNQQFGLSEQAIDERPDRARGATMNGWIASAARPRLRMSLGWSFLFVLLLMIAGTGLLSSLTAWTSLQTFTGRSGAGKGVSIFQSNHRPNRSATGIGGYDLRSRNDQAFAFDYDHSGKLDHLALYRPGAGNFWIMKNTEGAFSPVYAGDGIGGYEVKSSADRALAFDYEHSGKLDYLVLYRFGTDVILVVRNDGEGIFTPVYQQSEVDRAGSAENSNPLTDQTFVLDFDHTGKLDHLVRYRPSTGTMEIWTSSNGRFSRIQTVHVPDDGGNPRDSGAGAEQAFAFDYDHSGKLDHVVLYRPGSGRISILKNSAGTFTPVYQGDGIGGFDLKSANDRALAFDYEHTGKPDHLLLYRPGVGIATILKNTGGNFSPVYAGMGMGGYDLKHASDRALAFDFDHSGNLDHLVLYRPGTGIIQIAYLP